MSAASTVRAEALFCSPLQPSEFPNGSVVRYYVNDMVARHGEQGCAGLMAAEFRDHPQAAAERMEWAQFTVRWAFTPQPAAGALV